MVALLKVFDSFAAGFNLSCAFMPEYPWERQWYMLPNNSNVRVTNSTGINLYEHLTWSRHSKFAGLKRQ